MNEKPVKEAIQRIAFECQESGATKWQIVRIIKELEQIQGSEAQLRKRAVETLSSLNPGAARTFRSFEKLKVFTSKETREPFDRGNIIKSLLKETNVSRAVAEKIGSEVEDKIKDLNIDYLNTQLIREMVNVKLLEYGHEQTHSEYARIGMPIFEVEKKLEKGFFENPEILREYAWIKKITGKARELHFNSAVHVFSPEDFSTKIFCHSEFLLDTIEGIALKTKKLDSFLTIPLTIKAFNYSVAISSHAKSRRKIAENALSAQKIISLTGKRIAENALYTGEAWNEFSKEKESAVAAAKKALQCKDGSVENVLAIDSKYQLKLLETKDFENICIANNSKQKTSIFSFGAVKQAPICQLTAVNLEKISGANEKEDNFLEETGKIIETCISLGNEKKNELLKRGFLPKKLAAESKQALAFSGLFQASALFDPEKPEKTAEKILSLTGNETISLNLEETEVLEKFGATNERSRLQEMILKTSPKTRENFGFIYHAVNRKELEELIEENAAAKLISNANNDRFQ